MFEQHVDTVAELVTAPRVRRRTPERMSLGDTDRPGLQVHDHRRHLLDQACQASTRGDLMR